MIIRELLGLARALAAESAPVAADAVTVESVARDAEELLCHCLGKSRSYLYTWPEQAVQPAAEARYRELLALRQAGHPVAHLTGRRDFWSLDLEVSPSTLIPRPDTETLIEWALELTLPERARVLDLGTGTGAIALALAVTRPDWQITATDASAAALDVARRNGERLCPRRVRFLEGSWFQPLGDARFELIVSNPPYVEEGDAHLAQGDLRFEPRSALAAGSDGLADLRAIVRDAGSHLAPGAWLLLEHGFQQGAAVRRLLCEAGFDAVTTRRDLGGQERISGGRWRAQ